MQFSALRTTSKRSLIIFILFLISLTTEAQECPHIILSKELEPKLNQNEMSLLCPSNDKQKNIRDQIPHYQAKFYLKGFLQARGHLTPSFESKERKLLVTPGDIIKLHSFSVTPSNAKLQNELVRFYRGKIATPILLNQIESFILNAYKDEGHPCPKVQTTFSPKKAHLEAKITHLEKEVFDPLDIEDIKGLNSNFIKRFNAFKQNQIYKPLKLKLTQKRIHRSRVVQSTYYQTNCSESGDLSIKQRFVPGSPRTLRFGVGLNTEVGPIARIRWTHHRYKEMASTLQANLQSSLKEQSLNLSSEIFTDPKSPRRLWRSEFKLIRTSESDFDEFRSEIGQKLKWSRDGLNHYWSWQTGPAVSGSWFQTDQNDSRRSLVNTAWQFSFLMQNHTYEFYDIFPHEGHKIQLNIDTRPTFLHNEFDLFQFEMKSIKLFPLTTWGKGDVIAGLRLDYQSTWIDETTDIASVPPGLRYYGGGENTNRGHKLNSLPDNNGLGALTRALIRLELRKTHVFVPEVEMLVFNDFSQFSKRPWQLTSPKWTSPGLGLRWLSPIGPVQTHIAKPFRYDPTFKDEGLYFYIGLGGEL